MSYQKDGKFYWTPESGLEFPMTDPRQKELEQRIREAELLALNSAGFNSEYAANPSSWIEFDQKLQDREFPILKLNKPDVVVFYKPKPRKRKVYNPSWKRNFGFVNTCPVCGNNPTLKLLSNGAAFRIQHCGMATDWFSTAPKATSIWNRFGNVNTEKPKATDESPPNRAFNFK